MIQKSLDIKGTPNVRKLTKQRLSEWEERKCHALISSTILYAEENTSRKKGQLKKLKVKSSPHLLVEAKLVL